MTVTLFWLFNGPDRYVGGRQGEEQSQSSGWTQRKPAEEGEKKRHLYDYISGGKIKRQ